MIHSPVLPLRSPLRQRGERGELGLEIIDLPLIPLPFWWKCLRHFHQKGRAYSFFQFNTPA